MCFFPPPPLRSSDFLTWNETLRIPWSWRRDDIPVWCSRSICFQPCCVERNRLPCVRPPVSYFYSSVCPSLSCERIALDLSLASLTSVRLWKPCAKASKWLSFSHVISKNAHFSEPVFCIPGSLSRSISDNNASPKMDPRSEIIIGGPLCAEFYHYDPCLSQWLRQMMHLLFLFTLNS